MSDFDKEAEREKLREKYERDQAEREATQRMSDLLLKGATMTNTHCGTCGDPLFQQDGTTFCPSCHGNPDAVQGTDLEARPADESAGDAAAGRDEATGNDSIADERPADADARTADTDADEPSPQRQREQSSESNTRSAPTGASDRSETAETSQSSPASSAPAPRPDAARDRSHQSADDDRSDRARSPVASRPADGDRTAARASLVQALEKWADEAAIADDPRYAKECLEAAREASETLNTLR